MSNIQEFYELHHFLFFIITFIVLMYSVISSRKIKSAPNSSKQILNRESDLDINENSEEISDEQYEEVINERCTSVGSKVKLYYIKEDITLSLIISEHTNKADNKNLHYKLPLAIALYNKEAGSIIKFKKCETDLNFVYVEVLDVDNSEVKQTDESIINSIKIEKANDSFNQEINNEPIVKDKIVLSDNYIINNVLPITLIPENPNEFLRDLLRTRKAIITTYYTHKEKESKIWYANQMGESSDVMRNLRSRPEFRQGNWQESRIKKVEVSIKY